MVYFANQTMANIISFLQKCFVSCNGIVLPLNKIAYHLVKVAKCNSYVETLGDHSDAVHLWIKRSYEEDFVKAFKFQAKKAIKLLGISFGKIAVDMTSEPFYGKTRGLYTIGCSGEKFDAEFKFISVCLITRNKSIPLMALPVHMGSGVANLTIKLLEFCKSLFRTIRLATFDRGFYNAELIDYLEAKRIKYIILVPDKKGHIRDCYEQIEEFGKHQHQMNYSKKKSTWKPKTKIIICKNMGLDKNKKPINWIFASNINFRTRVEYVYYYMRRWQIETNYRVEDEGKIKSKSTNYLIRYFYFLISQLLHLLWIVNKNIKYYVPFKKYIDIIEEKLFYDYMQLEKM